MNETVAHMPVSSEGHIGIMTDGIPSANTCGHLDQLQVQKLLQCKGQVVCTEGLNGGLKALLFDFKELPLWNVATADEPAQDLPLIEVILNGMAPEAPPSTRAEDPLVMKGMELAICDLMATSLQASPCAVMPENIPSIVQVSHSPSPPTMLRSPEMASISPTPHSQTPTRANPANLMDEVLQLQGEMNTALEWLLTTKATMDSHQRDLVLNANIARHKNEAQATEAIKEVEACCVAAVEEADTHHAAAIKEAEACQAIHACTLEKSHKESMLELEHEAIAEEGQDCWAFLEAYRAVLWACPPEACVVLMYPLQLLTGNVPLAAILGMLATTPNWLQQPENWHQQPPTYRVRDASTPNQNQIAVPLIWLGSNYAKPRGRGSCGVRCHSWRMAPPKVERGETPGKASQGELPGSPQERL